MARIAVSNDKTHRTIGGFPHSNEENMERETGLEPATTCLGSRCATIAPLSHAPNVAAFRIVVKRLVVGCQWPVARRKRICNEPRTTDNRQT